MRGSFCQALPIGCMRVFMTPSCSSAVTLDSRCSGTLNSESSCRRAISSSWLRVSTSSETMVIRCSSVSTLTRIDWLATLRVRLVLVLADRLALGLGRLRLGGFGSCGASGAGAASTAVSRNARSSSSSETSPGRSGRSSACVDQRADGARVRRACGAAAATVPAIAMRSSSPIRSRSSPSGSCSFCSSSPSISLSGRWSTGSA